MRILFLTHSFNSLCQRLYVELTERGHEIAIEFDINDAVTCEAVALYRPELIVAPFLKRAIPPEIWQDHLCLILHPGIKGDRGPSALDWAILNGEQRWGVTVLQANGEMDAGDIWATEEFPMRPATKSSLYRNEVTEAAVRAVLRAVERFEQGDFRPEPLDYSRPDVRGELRPAMQQEQRGIDWSRDSTETVLRKIRAADGQPGVRDRVLEMPCHLYNANREGNLRGQPGEVIARRDEAICRATIDGAVWIGHLRPLEGESAGIKLPATRALGSRAERIPESPVSPFEETTDTWREIHYEERNAVGYLHFDFYNGAMNTEQCRRLRDALLAARERPTRVLVLMGGSDFWSNGIHLNCIEAAESPSDESWRNIEAMDDLTEAVITTTDKLVIAALQGNAGAGGVFLALGADRIVARRGIILNPHYKNMGNLYGSEYWTYLLPRRVGEAHGRAIMENRLPIGARKAVELGLIDEAFGEDADGFREQLATQVEALAASTDFAEKLEQKRLTRERDEAIRPLRDYRAAELERMKLNFYGFDPSYHVARYNFVYRIPLAWTPLHLAIHRRVAKGKAFADNMESGSRR